jgi:hypothetical protein
MRRWSAHMASADRAARTTAIDSFQDAIERAKEGLRATDLAVDFKHAAFEDSQALEGVRFCPACGAPFESTDGSERKLATALVALGRRDEIEIEALVW